MEQRVGGLYSGLTKSHFFLSKITSIQQMRAIGIAFRINHIWGLREQPGRCDSILWLRAFTFPGKYTEINEKFLRWTSTVGV